MIHTFLDPLVESQLESFLSLIISFLEQLQYNLIPSQIVTSSQVRVGTPLPLLSCCISGLGPEGLRQEMTDGWRRALHTGLSLFAEHVIAIQNACFFIEENRNPPLIWCLPRSTIMFTKFTLPYSSIIIFKPIT